MKQIGDVILHLEPRAGLTVLLVEQKLPFARRVAEPLLHPRPRPQGGRRAIAELDDGLVREHLTV